MAAPQFGIDKDGIAINPKCHFERNHRGGMQGYVESSQFLNFPQIRFSFPPMWFDTHQMAKHEWRMNIRQKSSWSRPYISLFNKQKFGIRIRLSARFYNSIEDIFIGIQNDYRIESSGESTFTVGTVAKTVLVPTYKTTYVDRHIPNTITLNDLIEKEIEDTRERLGGWRPAPPSLENVINFEEYVENLPEPSHIDDDEILRELELKIASM